MSSGNGPEQRPSEEELAAMSRDALGRTGAKLDGVGTVTSPDPWPGKGTRAEKRAQRVVALWFVLATLAGLAFLAALIWWPSEYRPPEDEQGHFWYSLYTPMLGITLGVAVLSLAVGGLLYTKLIMPEELTAQERTKNL